jgi:iron complex outermembrane receptor protein
MARTTTRSSLRRTAFWILWAGAGARGLAADEARTALPPRDLTEVSLTELAQMKVTSVAKQPEDLAMTAAAVHVVTPEAIEASGATTLVDLLALAPGVHVARLDPSQWAVGIRGFTSFLARSQLALMDGRTLYSPLFAGTYWDVQDTVLEDVARIEIVRGPGGTLWGANAVNGIVNVITKSAADTPGGLVVLGGGTEERAFGRARYGGPIGENGSFRAYLKYFDRDSGYHPVKAVDDSWHMGQGGFRTDWTLHSGETLTVQGDLYNGRAGREMVETDYDAPFLTDVVGRVKLDGGNLLGRWTRSASDGAQLQVQAYYDHTARTELVLEEHRDTGDLDVQYRFRPFGRHHLVVGGQYRASSGRTSGSDTVFFTPPDRVDNLGSLLVEDAIDLVPGRLHLRLGTKLEWNDYTGVDLQPSARLSFRPHSRHSLWAAVTRAVRTPSRVDRDISVTEGVAPGVPTFTRVLGSSAFETERVWAYEAGYRVRIADRVMIDAAVFYEHYPNLFSLQPGPSFKEADRLIFPFTVANGLRADASGFEVWSDIRFASTWSVRPAYSFLNMDVERAPGSQDVVSPVVSATSSPRHKVSVQSSLRLRPQITLDAWYRWYSHLNFPPVPVVSTLDARAGWRARPTVELALVGRDLLQPHHLEFGGGVPVERSVYGEVVWRF